MKKIRLLVPTMPKADRIHPYLEEIDRNRHYTNFGPLNDRFEQRVLAEVGSDHGASYYATTVANCTVGLELALQAAGLAPGSRVLLPTLTFVATATAIERVGMVPVFADVDAHTWALMPDTAREHAGMVDAFMPVSTFGYGHNASDWDALASDTGKPVIVDAAGAFGNQKPGRMTDVVYSFHATKSLGAGEGGMVISSNKARIDHIRRLSNFGIDTSRSLLAESGTNGKMSEYHAAVGLATFELWEDIKAQRRQLDKKFASALSARCPSLRMQKKAIDGIYPILATLLPRDAKASAVAQDLSEAGIETRRWYCPPLHLHPPMVDRPTTGSLPVAKDIGERILGIPFHLELSDSDVDYIVETLASSLVKAGLES
ncbi:DegT/DnrJ/EryC1/StrS family aminotransferase [Frateuria edaphi]|uniref:DegT/DnrJ/EryC1/StrS family aminotransferase n=1 Tax=Frateuria edaphi TaxID=2898793 RepID=UPI001E496843|nr:DegT/DnrJ/EryC1/StrS family aminotransferase [Frateuria edaphi]UGB44993.1 DegT/DnrJ/EryC1/StrS family aminotransferase [Frateuria edaphi]